MADINFTNVKIFGEFFGPNFVKGLADQTDTYTVVNDKKATVTFSGGFESNITFVQELHGQNFSYDPVTGRYSGRVDYYVAYEQGARENKWVFRSESSDGLNVALDVVNSNASNPNVSFSDLLVIPLRYKYIGGDYTDVYILGSFDDVARGNGGDDIFEGLTGNDKIWGGDGDDTLRGDEGLDTIRGDDGDDKIFGGSEDDRLLGNSGDDDISGDGGNDMIFGHDGADTLSGGQGADTIAGGADDDVLSGGGSADLLKGGAGQDKLKGGSGDDTLNGGDGDDHLSGGSGSDYLRGGGGDDVLKDTTGTNTLEGGAGDDTLKGGDGTDDLKGGHGDDVLSSGESSDFLEGGKGDDTLSGNGASGADHSTDTFIFLGEFGHDTITDFEVGFDGIYLGPLVDQTDVKTLNVGQDVIISVDIGLAEAQTILLEGVAGQFDRDIDISF